MKTIRIIKSIGIWYLYLVGLFFVLMAIDCFGPLGCPGCDSFWEQLLCFVMSIIPGAIIAGVAFFLRKKERILGTILIALAIFAFFFFKFYREFVEKIPMLFILVIIPFVLGALFVFTANQKVEE